MEIVRAHIEAYLHDPPRALSFFDPYVVIDWSRGPDLDFEVAYGHEAVAQAVARFVGAFDEYAYEVERLTDLGSGAILAAVIET